MSRLERGKVRPKSDTVGRIASALGLPPEKRAEFHRLAKLDQEPAGVRDAITGPPVPGLVVWKHLPGALYKIPHDAARLSLADPDRVFSEAVPAAASLLSWIALVQKPPARSHLRRMRREIERARAEAVEFRRKDPAPIAIHDPRDAEQVASANIPALWRSIVFSTARSSAAASSELAKWRYMTDIRSMGAGWLGFEFTNAEVQDKWGVRWAEPDTIRRVHDALILDRLWEPLGLGGAPLFDCYYCIVGHLIKRILQVDPTDLPPIREWRAGERPGQAIDNVAGLIVSIDERSRICDLCLFLRRLLNHPKAREIIGDSADQLAQACDHADRVWRGLCRAVYGTDDMPVKPS